MRVEVTGEGRSGGGGRNPKPNDFNPRPDHLSVVVVARQLPAGLSALSLVKIASAIVVLGLCPPVGQRRFKC